MMVGYRVAFHRRPFGQVPDALGLQHNYPNYRQHSVGLVTMGLDLGAFVAPDGDHLDAPINSGARISQLRAAYRHEY